MIIDGEIYNVGDWVYVRKYDYAYKMKIKAFRECPEGELLVVKERFNSDHRIVPASMIMGKVK